jgi:hypothetical protein
MKKKPPRRIESGADTAPRSAVLGSIPGLERLLPGRHHAGDTVRSRYGTWILPLAFRGRRLVAIVDGKLIG